MVSVLISMAALANDTVAPPDHTGPVSATAITWAQPFTLAQPSPYRGRGDSQTFSAGVILQLEVPEGYALQRAIDQPVLYVGDWPARVLRTDPAGTCVVAWSPAPADTSALTVFFGDTTLPERVDAEGAAAQLADATIAGVKPLSWTRTTATLQVPDLEGVWMAAEARAEGCRTPTKR